MSIKRTRRRSLNLRRRAFSLMEIMVVLLLIGLISAAVVVGVRGAREYGRKTTAGTEVVNICNGLEIFNGLKQRYPTQSEGLDILMEPIEGYENGILEKKGELKDPWGNPYLYILTNDRKDPYEVISLGSDGLEGTEDDISNLEANE